MVQAIRLPVKPVAPNRHIENFRSVAIRSLSEFGCFINTRCQSSLQNRNPRSVPVIRTSAITVDMEPNPQPPLLLRRDLLIEEDAVLREPA